MPKQENIPDLEFLSEAQNANMRFFASKIHVGHAPGYRDNEKTAYSKQNIKHDVALLQKRKINALIMVGDAEAIQSGEVDRIVWKHTKIIPIRNHEKLSLKTVDFTAPSQDQLAAVSKVVDYAMFTGRNAYICCGAGIGRSGTYVRAAVMDFLGVDAFTADKVCKYYYPKTQLEKQSQADVLMSYRGRNASSELSPKENIDSTLVPPQPTGYAPLPRDMRQNTSPILTHAHKVPPQIPPRTYTGRLPTLSQSHKIPPPVPLKPAKFIYPFIYWKDSGKKAAKSLKPGEFLIRESSSPGKLTIDYSNSNGKLFSRRIGYVQDRWQILDSKSSQKVEPISIIDSSNPRFHKIFTQILTEISAGLPNHKMVIPTEKEAGLLNVYSAYYSSKTSIGAYTALHSGLQQYFSSNYDLSGQGEAKSDLADKHDELGQKLDTKGYVELLDFQLKGFANKEQNSKTLVSMLGTLINKSNKMAVMPSTCSSALAFQPCHSGINKPELTNHWAPPVA